MLTQTVTITQNSNPNIIIGRRSTYETQQVIFDVSWLIQTYGEGTATLLIKRPKDASAYPVVAVLDGNTLTWTVSETDTQDKGHGECEIYWYVDGGLAKSCICGITILRDIGDTTETAPDPYETWVDELARLGSETLANAQAAQQSANNAAQSATEAGNSAAAALESEENALNSENAAKASEQAAAASAQGAEQSATEARQSATEAAQSATNAHDDATDASASADRAEQAAASIEGDTERAEAAERTAQGAATSAQGSASTASTKATEASQSAATAGQAASTATQKAADASTAATAAAGSASSASASATAAGNAQSAAETAQGKAEDAQEAAETAAQSIEDSAAQIDENTAGLVELRSAFSEITTEETISETVIEYYTSPWTSGGGINADGATVSVGSWAYTDKIAVQAGDVITCDALGGGGNRVTRPIRLLCAYNGDTPVSASGSSSEIHSYTVPDGVTHIVVTQASFTSYTGQRVIINSVETTSALWTKQDKIGGFRQTGDLASGDEFVFPITNVKQFKVFSFDGNITSFSSVKIGRKVDGVDKESITVDGTNLTIVNTYGAETVVAHGIAIADNIQILLTTGQGNRLASIRIVCKGNVFEYTALNNITWNADKGCPFVRSVGSVFTDCTASWTSRKINAPIWIFGDSYLTYDTARWPYYLIQDGYDVNCLLNAYAGENSQNAFTAFNSLMQSGIRPQIVVWALGMNDGDAVSDNAPNGNWLNILNKVIATCEGRGVELILCTIPTTPIINNNYKNAWVKNSGFRYVDFASGVGAGEDGVWFSGLLSADKVHPTTEGAKTLYYKFLSEVPEIVTNN